MKKELRDASSEGPVLQESKIIVIETTCASVEDARRIAHLLVEAKLAACCHIYPGVESVYEWEGKIHSEQESVLRIKTSIHRLLEAVEAVREHHSYQVPQITVMRCSSNCFLPYEEWILHQTSVYP